MMVQWLLLLGVIEQAAVRSSGSDGTGSGGMLFVAPSRVWVGVDSRVAGEFVGATEALCASGMLADVRLLTRVGANVTRLMLETMKGLVAQRTLVRTRQIAPFCFL